MIPEKYSIDDLHNYLNINKIASLNDLKRVLGTDIDKTVFRKLKRSHIDQVIHIEENIILQLKLLILIILGYGRIIIYVSQNTGR